MVHRPGGAAVIINPTHVIALHAATPGQPNKFVTDAARCVLGMSSGKFIAVIEPCDVVQQLLEAAR